MNAGPTGPNRLFAISALAGAILLALLYYAQLPLRVGFDIDAFHHIASVRELAKGEFPPRHNLVPGYIHQGHYGPYLVGLGFLARLSHADPARLLDWAGVANLLLYVLAFRLVVARLVGEAAGRWAALVPLLMWGPWPSMDMAWASLGWPGTTSLAEAYNFFYPNQAGLVLALGLLAFLLSPDGASPLAALDRKRGLVAILLMALLLTTHPLSAILMAATLASLAGAQWLSGRLRRSDVAWLAAIPAGGLALGALWPYYPVLALLPTFNWDWLRSSGGPVTRVDVGLAHRVIVPLAEPALSLVDVFGPALFGILGLLLLARGRKPFALVWFLVLAAMFLCPYVPMRHRFTFFAVIPLQVGLAALFEAAWSRGRAGQAAVLALIACGALSAGLRIQWALDQEAVSLDFLDPLLPPDAVVLANPALSNGVAGLTGRKVVCPQNPDMFLILAGGARRIYDVRRFFDPGTSTVRRNEIVRRWRPTHLLVDRIAGPMRFSYPLLAERDGFALYDLRPVLAAQPGPRH